MENYLTQITNYLLTQSWQIAVLILVIAAANLALKNRSAHVRYLLWLIVLAKCLIPPLIPIPLAILPQDKMPEQTLISNVEMPAVNVEMADTVRSKPIALPSLPVTSPTIMERLARVTARQWLGFGWIVGVAAFAVFAVIKALRTNLWLWRQRKSLPAELQTGIENLFSSFDFRSFPKVWLVDGIGQPFVWGLLRGSIYLPADFVKVNSAEHRRDVLGHEISHILRFDAAVNILQIIAQAVFWFHPFVWWANKKNRAEREKCCDEMAIARLGAKAKDYSIAIVNTLVVEHESTRPVPSLAVAGPVKNIEERIKTMLRPGKKFYKRPSLVTVTVVLLLALLIVPTALVLTARAEVKPETKKPAEREDKPTKSLHQAAIDGDIDRVKSLISKGADINAKDEKGWTSLHRAARYGQSDVAKLLIAKGADVKAKNIKGWTPLHRAASYGHSDVVKLLIAKGADVKAKNIWDGTPLHQASNRLVANLLIANGADVNRQNNDRKTPLHKAAERGHARVAEVLLAKGADVNAKDGWDYTPLYYAIWKKDKNTVRVLVTKGADVNFTSKYGYPPLHYAVWNEDVELAKLFVNNGAKFDVKDQDGWTAFRYAVTQGSQDLVELFVAKGAEVSNFHLAAFVGDLASVKRFVAQGKDVDTKAEFGWTPLYWAASTGQTDVAEFLIAKGANVNAKDEFGNTPIQDAARNGHQEVVAVLIASGADINAKDDNGRTPLLRAVGKGHKEVVEILVAKGADVNAKDRNGLTPLHNAALRGHKYVVEVLAGKGADINAKAKNGRMALHWVAFVGRKDMAELLVAKGADLNAKDKQGQTPLNLAAQRGHSGVVELLIAKGADVNAKDNRGGTSLWYAKDQGNKEIVELLRKQGAKEEAPVMSLHEAARDGDIEQVKSLISKGGNVNAMDDRLAGTPLHLAAYSGHRQVVEFLIANGANLNVRNKWNRTALDEAIDQGRTEIAELLRKHGAKSGSSIEAKKTKPTKSLLEAATSKFEIPKKNLEIPKRMQSCAANLRKIYAALKKYEKDKGTLPDWFSDLVPDYLSKETLLCPHDPKHKVRVRHLSDPRLPCSYGYEFSMARAPVKFRGNPLGGVTMRDWKTAEMRLFGDVIPLVRCYVHGPILNLTVSGKIYLSRMYWPIMFIPGYKQSEIFKLLEEASR